MKTKVLMSRTTPDGFKLEDLLVDVIEDLRLKNKWLDESSGTSNRKRTSQQSCMESQHSYHESTCNSSVSSERYHESD